MENRKPKIYFSKSRAGNFDDILKVKNYLAKYDCEIIEFTGGTYTPEKLDSSDFLLILPPILENYEFVGRGQYEEFLRVLGNKTKALPVIIINIDSNGIPYGVSTTKSRIIDKNWITDYGHFFLLDKDDKNPIGNIFDLNYKIDYNESWVSQIPVIDHISLIPIEVKQLTYEEVFNSLNLL